jgi:serralysin
MTEDSKWCFAFSPSYEPTERMALPRGYDWGPGKIIRVAFLDGSRDVHERVKNTATKWTGPEMANVSLVFISDPHKAEIRISFRYSGSWSALGKACCEIRSSAKPTMNFGWLTEQSDDVTLRSVVLHEFGHALGLIHEHQNPKGMIPWNRQAVLRDLSRPPNSWASDVIERNMFKVYEKAQSNYKTFDRSSIMLYPIPPEWVTDPSFVTSLNTDLSEIDRAYIRKMYPS